MKKSGRKGRNSFDSSEKEIKSSPTLGQYYVFVPTFLNRPKNLCRRFAQNQTFRRSVGEFSKDQLSTRVAATWNEPFRSNSNVKRGKMIALQLPFLLSFEWTFDERVQQEIYCKGGRRRQLPLLWNEYLEKIEVWALKLDWSQWVGSFCHCARWAGDAYLRTLSTKAPSWRNKNTVNWKLSSPTWIDHVGEWRVYEIELGMNFQISPIVTSILIGREEDCAYSRSFSTRQWTIDRMRNGEALSDYTKRQLIGIPIQP